MSKQMRTASQPSVEKKTPARGHRGRVTPPVRLLDRPPAYLRISMESMGYRMGNMPMSGIMLAGMSMILVGLPLAAYGLPPRLSWQISRGASSEGPPCAVLER